MVETWRIRCDARHVDVALQRIAARAGGRLDVAGRCASSPVVDEIEDGVRLLVPEQLGDSRQIGPIGLEVLHARPEVVRSAPMEHRHIVSTLEQQLDDPPTHELHAADYHCAHRRLLVSVKTDAVSAGDAG